MNPRGLQTLFIFEGNPSHPQWPFGEESQHVWKGWRLPCMPIIGQEILFSEIKDGKACVWEVSKVLMVHGELKDDPRDDGWHIEVFLK